MEQTPVSPSKTCRGCGKSLPLTEFYKHALMADHHLNFCKECVKVRVKYHRRENAEYYRTYDSWRYQNHEDRRLAQIRRERLRSLAEPEKNHARHTVGNAIRDGRLMRKACEKCGREDSHAHHEDYSKPLDVIFLCPPCHSMRHHEMRGQ